MEIFVIEGYDTLLRGDTKKLSENADEKNTGEIQPCWKFSTRQLTTNSKYPNETCSVYRLLKNKNKNRINRGHKKSVGENLR